MDTLRTIAFALLLLVFPAMLGAEEPEPALTLPGDAIIWLSPEKGLDMARLAYVEDKGDEFSRRIVIRVLRFDTDEYDFRLFSSRWEGQSIPTMREWAASKALTAAINASMYLKDGQTSTGYMRSGERTNNSRIVSRYGAFFVAGPRENGLPRAAVLDRSVDDWQNLLPRYDIVVQNFRLMGPDSQQIWPAKGPEHAIAAIAEDMNGRILFLHCSDPASVHDFVEALKAHTDLNLNSAMYVEGGSEAPCSSVCPNPPALERHVARILHVFLPRRRHSPAQHPRRHTPPTLIKDPPPRTRRRSQPPTPQSGTDNGPSTLR